MSQVPDWRKPVHSLAKKDGAADTRFNMTKTIGYRGYGTTCLTKPQQTVLQYIYENRLQPVDFEFDLAYGPLSGVSFEERLLTAYAMGQLGDAKEKLCDQCGQRGHARSRCAD